MLARRLIEDGFRRSAHAIVAMERSDSLAITLLAVLKLGGAYSWIDPASTPAFIYPPFSFTCGTGGREQRYKALEIRPFLAEPAPGASPNLPILTREGDTACILPDARGRLTVVVPHESITALCTGAPPQGEWSGEPGAFDLWAALMSGQTLGINRIPLQSAA